MCTYKVIATPTNSWASFSNPNNYLLLAPLITNKNYLPVFDFAKELTLESPKESLFEMSKIAVSKSAWDTIFDCTSNFAYKNPYLTAALTLLTTAFVYRKELEGTVKNTSKVVDLTSQIRPDVTNVDAFSLFPVTDEALNVPFTLKVALYAVQFGLYYCVLPLFRITDYVFNKKDTLNLSSMGLKKVPAISSQIESLNLDNNNIRVIPESFLETTQVRELSITNNPLTQEPSSFDKLSNKSILNIKLAVWVNTVNSSGQEKETKKIAASRISDCFKNDSSVIDLSDLELDNFPEVLSLLPNLTQLNLNSNTITKTPDDFGNLSEETILTIKLDVWVNSNNENAQEKENKKIAASRIMDCFKNNSTSLDLSNLGLKKLPSEINQLVQVTRISLGGNNFEYTPFPRGNLNRETKVALDDNDIQIIPRLFIKSSKFNTLRLKLLIWANDKNISADEKNGRKIVSNRIIDCALNKSKILDLANMKLTSLPDIFQYLTHLEQLRLLNNDLTSIPNSIRSLSILRSLGLVHNKIETIPDSIAALSNLRYLYLDNNEIQVIPELFKNSRKIEVLYLGRNRLRELPSFLENMTQLQELNVMMNMIETIPDSFVSLRSLSTLIIDNNRLREIPTGFNTITHSLNISADHNLFTEAEILRTTNELPSNVNLIAYAYNPLNTTEALRNLSLVQLLDGLKTQAMAYNIIPEKDWITLDAHAQELAEFTTFLKELPMMRDWQVLANKRNLLETIVKILDKMTEYSEFRKTCGLIAHDAVADCGNRKAVGLIRMAVFLDWYCDSYTKETLSKIAKSGARFDALFKYATDKAQAVGIGIQMEVIIKYLNDLNASLELGIPVSSMLYERIIIVTKSDIAAAKAHVLAQEPESRYVWLADFPGTRKLYETQFEAIENKDEYDTMPLDDETDQAYELRCNEMPAKITKDKVAFLKTVIKF
jgi:Leucine-rich repeat (LRR) protein